MTRDACSGSPTCSGADLNTPLSRNLSRPVCPVSVRLRPAVAVHRAGRRGAGPRARGAGVPAPAHSTWAVPADCRCSEVAVDLRDPHRAAPAVADRDVRRPAAPPGRRRPAARARPLLRYGRGIDTRRFADTGFEYRFSSVEAVHAFAREPSGCARGPGAPATLPLPRGRRALPAPRPLGRSTAG